MAWRGGFWGGQVRSRATRKARANARWDRILFYSQSGKSREAVAEEMGIKLDTLNRMIRQYTGVRDWPVAAEHHPTQPQTSTV